MESCEEGRDEREDHRIVGTDTLTLLRCFTSKARTKTLCEAVARSREDIVRRFLMEKADPNSVEGEGTRDTAVHMAARRGKPYIMGLLLGFIDGKKPHFSSSEAVFAAFPSIMTANSNGDSPLHIAVKCGHSEIVRVLLSVFDASTVCDPVTQGLSQVAWFNAFPAIIQGNKENDTPLHIAVRHGDAGIMELLLALTDATTRFESAVAELTNASLKAHGKERTPLYKSLQAHQKDREHPLVCERARDMRTEEFDKQMQYEKKVRTLLNSKNNRNDSPMDAMATGERCPEGDVCWFFTFFCATEFHLLVELDQEVFRNAKLQDKIRCQPKLTIAKTRLVEAFFSVARSFPEAVATLLQIANECGEGDESCRFGMLDPRYLQILQQTLICHDMEGLVTERFASMMRCAPRASSILLDAVTNTPEECDPDLDPIPRRFVPPRGELYPVTCAYEDEREWRVDRKSHAPPWHVKLKHAGGGSNRMAWNPPPNYTACTVFTVNLRGLAQPYVLCNLAAATDDILYTKLSVFALLSYHWEQLRCLFIQDMVYESVAIIVLSCWTYASPPVLESSVNYGFLSRLSWTLVAGHGVLEATILLWTGIRHLGEVGRGPTCEWAGRNWHRIVLSIQTIGVAIASTEDHWPGMNHKISLALGTTSLFHWLTMLYKLRAFVKTGTRLLPILKSITPVGGMLVILTFLLLGFVHVFWGWKRSQSDEISTWHVLTFLFIGDNFMNDDFLVDLSSERRWLLMILGGSSYFVFSCCTLNLFIAVLSEVYEQQQEQMFVTFLRERACICSFLLLRPQFPLPQCVTEFLEWAGINHRWMEALLLFLLGATSTVTATVTCMQLQINNWPAALLLAFWAVLQQAFMQGDITKDWYDKYLWYCADNSGVEDLLSLGHKPKDSMFPQCRSWKLKGYISEILSRMEMQDNAIAKLGQASAKLGEASAKSEAELKGKLKELGEQLSNIAAQLPLGCHESAPTHKEASAQRGEASQTSSHKDTIGDPEEIERDEPVLATRECATGSPQTEPVAGFVPREKPKKRAKGNKNHERLAMDANGS